MQYRTRVLNISPYCPTEVILAYNLSQHSKLSAVADTTTVNLPSQPQIVTQMISACVNHMQEMLQRGASLHSIVTEYY